MRSVFKLLMMILSVMLAPMAWGQAAVPISGQVVNLFGQPIPFAPVRICSITSTGSQCIPTAAIYGDYTLSNPPIANPTAADQYGNYTVYAPALASPNLYVVQVFPSANITWNYVRSGPSTGGGGGGGTVSLVGLSMPSWFTVSGTNPITTAGTFSVIPTIGQTSHQVIGTCGTTTSFAPCSLVAADIPALPYLPSGTQLPVTITATAHQVLNSYTSGTGLFTAVQLSLADIAAGASATGLYDFGGATQVRLPVRPGYTAAASGEIGYDSTNLNMHFNIASTDLLMLGFPSASGLPTNNDCAKFTIIGAWVEVTDAGAPCGSGGGSSVWSALTNPTTSLALTMGSNTTTFTFGATTGTADLFKWVDTASNTGTGILAHFTTATGSSEIPWQADANGVGWQVRADGTFHSVGATVAGFIDFGAGPDPAAAPTSTIRMTAPTSATAYKVNLPGAQGAGALSNDGSGNLSWNPSSSCPLVNATNICITASPYNASVAGATTTTTSGTFGVGTSGSVGSCSTFLPNEGVYIAGAGASGANYIGTVVTCTGTTLTVTPSTSTSVATSTVVQHDESAAINAAITALASTGGTIYFPDPGLYLVNGPFRDPSAANALIDMPIIASVGAATNITIALRGLTKTTPNFAALSGPVLETSVDVSGGNFIGGQNTGGFTAVQLVIQHMNLVSTHLGPQLNMVNASLINAFSLDDVLIGGSGCSAAPSSGSGGFGIMTPNLGNNFEVTIDKTGVFCMAVGAVLQEHTQVGTLWMAATHNCVVAQGGGTGANSITADYIWTQGCINYLLSGTTAARLSFPLFDMESDAGTGVNIFDSGNLLSGFVFYRKDNVAGTDGPVTIGGTAQNLSLFNLSSGAMTLSGSAGGLDLFKVGGGAGISLGGTGTAVDLWNMISVGSGVAGGHALALLDSTAGNWAQVISLSGVSGPGFIENPSFMVSCWSSSIDITTHACDTGFSRVSADVVALGNGTQGDSSGTFNAFGYLGPTTAPSGSCTSGQNGTWVFSQDGHATFCNGTTWTVKI